MSFDDDPLASGPIREGEDSMADVLGGFPRHLTTQLIEEGAERESKRQVLGVWVLAAALTLFALAQPAAPGPWPATFDRPIGALGLDAWPGEGGELQRNLAAAFGAHLAEQIRLLLSAVAYGLCLPVAFAITRPFGASFGLRLAVALAVLLSGSAWLSGTDPAGSTVALLFALELFRRLWAEPPGAPLRTLVALALGALVVPPLFWLLPAVLVTQLTGSVRAQCRAAVVACTAVVAVLIVAWWGQLTFVDASVWEVLDFERYFGDGNQGRGLLEVLTSWGVTTGRASLGAVASLGLAALGLASLLFLRRGEAEERPPAWLLVWCLAPLCAAMASSAELAAFTALLLLPVALVGLMDLVARQDEPVGRGLAVLLPLVQVGLLAAGLVPATGDPALRDWQAEAIRTLEPDDLVVSADPVHREQLARRWGLDVVAARPYGLTPGVEVAVERAWAAGRRVAIDAPSFGDGVGDALAAALAARGETFALGGAPPVGAERD